MQKIFLGIYLWGILSAAAIAAEETQPARPAAEWPDRITIKGDLRLREDWLKQADAPGRNRVRFRARINAEAKVNEEIKGVFGLCSGSDDPTSANQTFGEEFSHKPVRIDLAYLEWTPKLIEETGVGKLTLDGGKMRNPFLLVDELIFDPDVNPEGFAGGYKAKPFDVLELMLNGGAMWYYERSADPETMLYVGQAGGKLQNDQGYYVFLGGSVYWFANVEGNKAFDSENKDRFFGNTYKTVVNNGVTNLVYANEYHEWEGMVEAGGPLPMTQMPFKVYGNYVGNAAVSENGNGYQAGIQINDLRDKGSFMLSYAFRELQADATMAAMTDSDWWIGGTNGKGHRLQAGYQILKNWSLICSWYFNNVIDLDSDPKNLQRLIIDLNAKF